MLPAATSHFQYIKIGRWNSRINPCKRHSESLANKYISIYWTLKGFTEIDTGVVRAVVISRTNADLYDTVHCSNFKSAKAADQS